MKFLIKTLLIALLSYLGGLFMPWWIVVIVSFVVGAAVPSRSVTSFLSGFLGVGLLWLIYLWILDLRADSIISNQIAPLFQMDESTYLILASAFLGAIVGGMGALSGNLFLKILLRKKKGVYN